LNQFSGQGSFIIFKLREKLSGVRNFNEKYPTSTAGSDESAARAFFLFGGHESTHENFFKIQFCFLRGHKAADLKKGS
jgi:hypothetical protein